ncbi:hypothetical protein [Streptosporangium sp. NPDC000396]|uniref:hypothetical protein n=1 Tax=Streptosporangium sp. NPDC000396 TaxID=3366185 RepID=UPI00368DCD33
MRSLTRLEWRDEWVGARPADVALDALGRFCAACERRLPQAAIAWHAVRQEPIDGRLTAADWAETIPLCHNCAAAATRSEADLETVLLPYRDLTFLLGDDSPLRYERGDGDGDGDGDAGGRVMVIAGGGRGQETVAYFALNEHIPALGSEFPFEPDADRLTRDWVDPRMSLRTRAWDAAGTAAAQLRTAPREHHAAVLDLASMLADETGFWSTWATVLWREMGDREVLERVLQPQAAGPAATLSPEAAVPHAFPATRPGWMPPTEPAGA